MTGVTRKYRAHVIWLLFCLGCLRQETRPDALPPSQAGPSAESIDPDAELAAYLRGRMLMVPVAGVGPQQVPDTFLAPRSIGRRHLASDILAPRGTPVVSVDDGTIIRIGHNRYGGNIIYAVDPNERLLYYYAHLDRFADGLSAGQRVRRGDLLGYVGTTGNAPANIPHLHFQLMLRPTVLAYASQGGPPIDARPYFLLAGPSL